MAFKDTLVQLAIPMVKAVGKEQLVELLSKIKSNNNAEVYEHTIKSVHSGFKLLKDLTKKTKTKIDDGIVDMVLEAFEEVAEADDITL